MAKKSVIRILALISLSIVAATRALASPINPEKFKYTSLSSGSTIELYVNKPRIVFDGHSVVGGNSCEDRPEYYCLVGGDAFFVFPKRISSERSSWEYKGQTFKTEKRVFGELFGRKYSAFLIFRQDEAENYWYIYSPRDGLIAFGLLGKSANSTFLIDGRCGFGANGCGKN
jgi:hypothetical protein